MTGNARTSALTAPVFRWGTQLRSQPYPMAQGENILPDPPCTDVR
jgi:hypothetical protein